MTVPSALTGPVAMTFVPALSSAGARGAGFRISTVFGSVWVAV
jgi:hypothetical protein